MHVLTVDDSDPQDDDLGSFALQNGFYQPGIVFQIKRLPEDSLGDFPVAGGGVRGDARIWLVPVDGDHQ